jgi:hypothetical protein
MAVRKLHDHQGGDGVSDSWSSPCRACGFNQSLFRGPEAFRAFLHLAQGGPEGADLAMAMALEALADLNARAQEHLRSMPTQHSVTRN